MSTRRRSVMQGLYAITGDDPAFFLNLDQSITAALVGGANLVQYRDKSGADFLTKKSRASQIKVLCQHHGVDLIINDDVALALAVDAYGVHLGNADMSLTDARRHLGAQRIIGVSCYNELERALAAQQQGADYVAFGRFFSSGSKPAAVLASLDLLSQARPLLHIPIVAIGGITCDNAKILIEHGADAVAVIQGIFSQKDIRQAARCFQQVFIKHAVSH